MPNPIPFISAARPVFPEYSPAHDKHDGLVCVSDALTPEMLLAAYRKGVFPWFSEHGLFYWFAQHPRAVLLPERLHIGRSLAKTLRRKSYRVSVNACFAEVIAACAQIPRAEQGGTWITPDFQVAYTALHRLGHAHSFECWLPDGAVASGGRAVRRANRQRVLRRIHVCPPRRCVQNRLCLRRAVSGALRHPLD